MKNTDLRSTTRMRSHLVVLSLPLQGSSGMRIGATTSLNRATSTIFRRKQRVTWLPI